MLEKDIERKVCLYAKSKDILAVKQEWPGRRGAPDRMFITREGVSFMIEFKTATGKLTRNQSRTIVMLCDRNYPVYIVNNVETGKALMDLYANAE